MSSVRTNPCRRLEGAHRIGLRTLRTTVDMTTTTSRTATTNTTAAAATAWALAATQRIDSLFVYIDRALVHLRTTDAELATFGRTGR